MDYALVNEKEASVIVRRLETDRSYLETYFTGWQLIENYINHNAKGKETPEKHWAQYNEIMTKVPTSTIWK